MIFLSGLVAGLFIASPLILLFKMLDYRRYKMTNELEKASWGHNGPYLGDLTVDEVEALGYTIHFYSTERVKTEAQDETSN